MTLTHPSQLRNIQHDYAQSEHASPLLVTVHRPVLSGLLCTPHNLSHRVSPKHCVYVYVCVCVVHILWDIVLQIVTKIVIYLKDTVRFGSGTTVDICLYIATSHSLVPNYILYILNILYFSVL